MVELYILEFIRLTWWLRYTVRERITSVSIRTSTNGSMIYNCTLSRKSTRTWAWVTTFFLNTCFIGWTFLVNDTFGTAVRGRPYVIRFARARRAFAYCSAFRVGTARGWITRINGFVIHRLNFWCCNKKLNNV